MRFYVILKFFERNSDQFIGVRNALCSHCRFLQQRMVAKQPQKLLGAFSGLRCVPEPPQRITGMTGALMPPAWRFSSQKAVKFRRKQNNMKINATLFAKNRGVLYKNSMPDAHKKAIDEIIAAGQRLDARGLAPATSGNYSARLPDGTIAITVSGRHKGRMVTDDVMLIDADGKPLEDKKPSAETLLHVVLYNHYPEANAVLHTHSVPGVALTRALPKNDTVVFEGYEMLKAFPGITTHETKIEVPVFDNTQDMNALGKDVAPRLKPDTAAYIIRDHGIYAWGRDMAEAERVMEAMEHILSCEIEMMKIKGAAA